MVDETRREVVVGFFSFTVVPPEHERAYDEWHRLDHLPEQYGIPGIVRGDRWVAIDPPGSGLCAAQHLTLYLMTEPVPETLRHFRRLAVDLRERGRFFAHRESLLFGAWSLVDRQASPHAIVAADVVPWRPATGVHVIVDPSDGSLDGPDRHELLVGTDGVAGVWTFATTSDLHHDSWVSRPSRITVAWLDAPPADVALRIAAADDSAKSADSANSADSAPAPLLARTYATLGPPP